MKILFFDELNSTNVYLYDKISEKHDISDTVVVAAHQTAGRGMDKNRWESEKGKNLLFSIALNVNYLEAENQFKISQAVSVSMVETLSQFCPGRNWRGTIPIPTRLDLWILSKDSAMTALIPRR